MSSELLDIDNDQNNKSLSLEMKAGGHAFLTICDDENILYYYLTPDDEGINKANKIIESIKEWTQHIRRNHIQ